VLLMAEVASSRSVYFTEKARNKLNSTANGAPGNPVNDKNVVWGLGLLVMGKRHGWTRSTFLACLACWLHCFSTVCIITGMRTSGTNHKAAEIEPSVE
jgi:hypothetical protein